MLCRPRTQPDTGRDIDIHRLLDVGRRSSPQGPNSRSNALTRSVRAWSGPALPTRHQQPCTATRDANELTLNEIGRVSLRTTAPLFFGRSTAARNRTTGSFILVDRTTNETVGAGMILGPHQLGR